MFQYVYDWLTRNSSIYCIVCSVWFRCSTSTIYHFDNLSDICSVIMLILGDSGGEHMGSLAVGNDASREWNKKIKYHFYSQSVIYSIYI